jgi:hypothetical protein
MLPGTFAVEVGKQALKFVYEQPLLRTCDMASRYSFWRADARGPGVARVGGLGGGEGEREAGCMAFDARI